MNLSFSALNRPYLIQSLQKQPLDLLVIGGGITGAGIALDARVRGMHVGLLEMQDFAAGTSSRSTKLVHGGLRYLKQLELGLVAEVGRERAVVYENAPHVTTPVPMLLPVVKGGSLRKWEAALALTVYDFLAGVKSGERRRMLSAAQTLAAEPLLDADQVTGGALYYEYRTDDARLTLEAIKEAVSRGALALNYAKVTGFLYEKDRINGVTFEDQLTDRTYQLRAHQVVNAAGPWVDRVDSLSTPQAEEKLFHTKGVHLVVDQQKFPLKQAVYFDVPGGRMIFAIPRAGKTYIGTTDTSYEGSLENPSLTPADRDYLLDSVNSMFPSVKLLPGDVESYWVGLRPLIRQKGKGPGEISRKDEIFQYPSGLVTIAGGKLTGYRKMAERVVDLIAGRLQQSSSQSFPACTTHRIPLSGGQVGGAASFPEFIRQKTRSGVLSGISEVEARRLPALYGSNIDRLFSFIPEDSSETAIFGIPPVLLAQLRYSLEDEMVTSPADFFVRRTGALYFNIDFVRTWEEPVWVFMNHYFGWSHDQAQQYRLQLRQLLSSSPIGRGVQLR